MNESLLHFLNIFFFVFHAALVLFNVLGWLFKQTRFWNLLTLSATALSWFVLGIWQGWGYCPCTDWHWWVRSQLGLEVETNSYIDFLLRNLLNINLSRTLVDSATLIILIICFLASLWVNRKKINILDR